MPRNLIKETCMASLSLTLSSSLHIFFLLSLVSQRLPSASVFLEGLPACFALPLFFLSYDLS